jgi:hypothetical protein
MFCMPAKNWPVAYTIKNFTVVIILHAVALSFTSTSTLIFSDNAGADCPIGLTPQGWLPTIPANIRQGGIKWQ